MRGFGLRHQSTQAHYGDMQEVCSKLSKRSRGRERTEDEGLFPLLLFSSPLEGRGWGPSLS